MWTDLLDAIVNLLFVLLVVWYSYTTDKRLDKLEQKKDGDSNAY
jgi:hypothetical protein